MHKLLRGAAVIAACGVGSVVGSSSALAALTSSSRVTTVRPAGDMFSEPVIAFATGDGKKYGRGISETSEKAKARLEELVARCDGNFIAGTNPGPWKSKRKWGTVRVQVLSRRGKVIKRPPRRQLESAEPGKYRFRYSWKLRRGWELCALRGGFTISIDEAGGDLFSTARVYYPKPDKGSTPRRGIFVDPWASLERRTTTMLVFVRRTG